MIPVMRLTPSWTASKSSLCASGVFSCASSSRSAVVSVMAVSGWVSSCASMPRSGFVQGWVVCGGGAEAAEPTWPMRSTKAG